MKYTRDLHSTETFKSGLINVFTYMLHTLCLVSYLSFMFPSGLLGSLQHYVAGFPVGGRVDRLFSYRGLGGPARVG